MSPAPKGKESGAARILGSGTSGLLELLIFHPIDTIAKRLMNNSSTSSFNQVIFKDKAKMGFVPRYLSLFPGLGAAAGYKILQRVYKFGGMYVVIITNNLLSRHVLFCLASRMILSHIVLAPRFFS